MCHTKHFTTRWVQYGLIALLSILFTQCKSDKSSDSPTSNNGQDCHPIRKHSSLNLLLTTGTNPSDKEILDKFNLIKDASGNPITDKIKIKRCPCDQGLVNIALPHDFIFEGHDGTVAITPTAGGSSGDVDLTDFGTVAVNIEVSTFDGPDFGNPRDSLPGKAESDSIRYQFERAIAVGKNASLKAVKIAILDSGFDPDIFKSTNAWKTSTTICQGGSGSDKGWNFLDYPVSINTLDSQRIKHGTRVAFLAAQQFANSDVPVNIIPLKVLNRDNKGDLFGILCALETARKNKADIINMSLGYYGDHDAIFEEYIKRTTNDNIWIVVAAGNQSGKKSERNLSIMTPTFYPAMFSKTYKRVVAVTTVTRDTTTGKLATCERQNFDPRFVVGVKDDKDCRFKLPKSPDQLNGLLIFGTSYASPILAGWLGQSIRKTPLTGPYPRQEIVNRMTNSGVPGLYLGRTITRQ